ncbi:AMP-binding protein [Leifsonia kafniensis]|uniref:AMP-binding protein n=1 Tax=Leifsonia kafniensis TaxID=475957 RepID=A0ABP7K7F2_9MICO
MPFLDRLQRWAELTPHATAIDVDGHRLSFRELHDAAEAQLVCDQRTQPSRITALALPNGTDFVVQFAAGVANDSRCAVLDPGWPVPVRSAVDRQLSAVAAIEPATADTGPASRRHAPVLSDGPGDSVFLYGFTSGTTSVPKAFTRNRQSWQLSFEASADVFGLTRDDRTLAPGPFSSSLTLYALCESLYTGAALFGLSSFDVGAALRCLRKNSITRVVAVPSALQLIAERALSADGAADGGADCAPGTGLTSIVSAGSKLQGETLALLRRWAPNATIFEYYGAAELGFVAASAHRPDDGARSEARFPHDRATAVGTAFPGVEVRIQNDEGHALGQRQSGSIAVRSRLVCDGYDWGDDGEAFQRVGDWCTVGDQGYLDDDDVLHFLGRRTDMIITGGHNVYPHEVEAALHSVPGVRTALVTGLPDPRRGHRLVAAILLPDGVAAEPGTTDADTTDADMTDADMTVALRNACRAALTVPKRPRTYYAMTELPLTTSGKLSRNLLARWILDGDPRVRTL